MPEMRSLAGALEHLSMVNVRICAHTNNVAHLALQREVEWHGHFVLNFFSCVVLHTLRWAFV